MIKYAFLSVKEVIYVFFSTSDSFRWHLSAGGLHWNKEETLNFTLLLIPPVEARGTGDAFNGHYNTHSKFMY